MDRFGTALAAFRRRAGLTQGNLSAALGGRPSRSSIANIEAGRQRPSLGFWETFARTYPEDATALQDAFENARRVEARPDTKRAPSRAGRHPAGAVLGGHLLIQRLDIIYVFRESRSPEEIIELRRVQALRNGAHDFSLKQAHEGSDRFELVPEVLYGGRLVENTRYTPRGETLYLRRIDFQRQLRRGAEHEFGLRYWVERDPEPGDGVAVEMTNRVALVGVHLSFLGTKRPAVCWRFDKSPDSHLGLDEPTAETLLPTDQPTALFPRPELGTAFGIAWRWSKVPSDSLRHVQPERTG